MQTGNGDLSSDDIVGVPYVPGPRASRALWRARRGLVDAWRRTAPPPLLLQEAITGLYDNRVLGFLVEAGIPDLLDRPRTAAELAAEIGGDPDALERVLRYAASRRFVTARRRGRFGPSPTTRFLRTDRELSWADLVARSTSAEHWEIWRRLDATVGVPRSALEPAPDPEIDAVGTAVQALALARDLPWDAVTDVCDVAGGNGAAVEILLRAHPHLRGTVVDRPEVVARPRPALADGPLAERASLVGGDYLHDVPPGHDRYLLLAIMTGCDDDQAVAVLASVRTAMGPAARLLVVDNELAERPVDTYAQHTDLLLLALGAGRERTRRQATALFTRAGLRVVAVHPLFTGSVAVELAPA